MGFGGCRAPPLNAIPGPGCHLELGTVSLTLPKTKTNVGPCDRAPWSLREMCASGAGACVKEGVSLGVGGRPWPAAVSAAVRLGHPRSYVGSPNGTPAADRDPEWGQ